MLGCHRCPFGVGVRARSTNFADASMFPSPGRDNLVSPGRNRRPLTRWNGGRHTRRRILGGFKREQGTERGVLLAPSRDPSWPVPFHPTPTPFHARAARAFVFPKTDSSPDSLTRSKTCLRRDTGRAGEDCYSRLGNAHKNFRKSRKLERPAPSSRTKIRPLGRLAGRARRHPAAQRRRDDPNGPMQFDYLFSDANSPGLKLPGSFDETASDPASSSADGGATPSE